MASVGYQAGNYGQGNPGQPQGYQGGYQNPGYPQGGPSYQGGYQNPGPGYNNPGGYPNNQGFNNQGGNMQGQGMPYNQPYNNQQQNVQVINNVQIQQNYSGGGTHISCCLAISVLIINIFLPGIGTMIGSCFIMDPLVRANVCCAGVCQLLTAPCIIGWCFAICYSCYFITVASTGEPLEGLYLQKHPTAKTVR